MISCEFIGGYKDDPLAYQTALRWTGVLAERALMVATHAWNLAGAQRVGLRTAYMARPDEWGPLEPRPSRPEAEVDLAAADFADLVAQLRL